jgi:DNA-binding response OmpR family regulator
MMTGTVDAVDAVQARQAGVDDYCVKTPDGAPLLAALKNLSDKNIGLHT